MADSRDGRPRADGQMLSFELGDGEGVFTGRLQRGDRIITGHSTPKNSKVHGFRYAAHAERRT